MEKVWIGLSVLVLVAIPVGMYWTTMNEGSEVLGELAAEYGVCDVGECTEADKLYFASEIIDRSEYKSNWQVRWCLGVDGWADTEVRRGGWLVGPMMHVGYLACPE